MEFNGFSNEPVSFMFYVTRQIVQKYLRSEQAYRLHKPARWRIIENYTYVTRIDAQSGQSGRYSGYFKAKLQNEVPFHRD